MIIRIITFLVILSVILLADENKGESTRITKSVDQTSEKVIHVDITLGNGKIYLEKGSPQKVFEGEFTYEQHAPEINYEIVGEDGRLTIQFDENQNREKGKEKKFTHLSSLDDLYGNECHLKLSPNLPIVLNLDLGVIKGEMNLGGLQLRKIILSSGVSEAQINFNEPNPISLEYFDVEAGVGALEISNLGNANFQRFKFDGGIGKYILDFAGNNYKESKVDIGVGLGKVKLYLPRSAGIRMKVDKSFLCSFSIDDIYKKNDYYYNQNWGKKDNSLDMNIETGVGQLSVVWVGE